MKKILALLLCTICILPLSSCSNTIVFNNIDTSFLNFTEKEGKTYIQSQFDYVYSIDFEKFCFHLEKKKCLKKNLMETQ